MPLTKTLRLVPIVLAATALSGCALLDTTADGGDAPEVTCERFHGVIDDLRTLDPASMGVGDLLGQVGGSFMEIRALVDDAGDPQLGESITTLSDALNSSIAAAQGNVTAMWGEFETTLQDPDVQDAVTYLSDVCGKPLGN